MLWIWTRVYKIGLFKRGRKKEKKDLTHVMLPIISHHLIMPTSWHDEVMWWGQHDILSRIPIIVGYSIVEQAQLTIPHTDWCSHMLNQPTVDSWSQIMMMLLLICTLKWIMSKLIIHFHGQKVTTAALLACNSCTHMCAHSHPHWYIVHGIKYRKQASSFAHIHLLACVEGECDDIGFATLSNITTHTSTHASLIMINI